MSNNEKKDLELTIEELKAFEVLVIKNRDDWKLQKETDLSYTDSIKLIQKIRKLQWLKY